MNQQLQLLILSDLKFILSKDPLGTFKAQTDIIKITDYDLKSSWEFFPAPNTNTTWGPRYVRIDPDTMQLALPIRCGKWIHEAVHEQQYQRYGTLGFWARYTIGLQGNQLENEAYGIENKWLGQFGLHDQA